MRALRAFGRFWYDFIIGDDWKVAAGVLVALGLTLLLLTLGLPERVVTVLGAVLVLAAFALVLAIDLRPKPKR
jgi:hypothetical protein